MGTKWDSTHLSPDGSKELSISDPPRPCYEVTWDISKVLNYIDSLMVDRVLRTGGNEEQTRLFLTVVRAHKPGCSSTLVRWLRSLLNKAGIDAIFKAHSTQSAATSVAVSPHVTS